ncbi:MAG: glycine cleavage system protein GcvH [Armatimonadetes bacterium]|nr:glycine cleavage system protein GcvH [Armatimonadota bacterium]
MDVPSNLKYTKTDEWVRVEGDEIVIGITDYAQGELGDIVYVELPEPGRYLQKEQAFGAVDSNKTTSELYTPVEGEVAAANGNLVSAMELINTDPYGEGWIVRIRATDLSPLDDLMSADEYAAYRSDH